MQHDEFVGLVQSRARLSARGEAERAIAATLSTLGDRLAGNEAEHLASQLPQGVGDSVTTTRDGNHPTKLTADEFYNEVADRAEADRPDAQYQAKAVMSVVQEAVSEGEMQHVRQQLPEDYNDLFEYDTSGA